MKNVLKQIQNDFPDVHFVPKDSFYWSSRNSTIFYVPEALLSIEGSWSLLHELGHALLEHKFFKSDFGLLKLEVEAWVKAQTIASTYQVEISQDHIEDCLDSYRDWLYQRSTCPHCLSSSLQIEASTYRCFNCYNTWRVSASRTCRTYRKKQKAPVIGAF